jgi:hypothetical protein
MMIEGFLVVDDEERIDVAFDTTTSGRASAGHRI